MIKCYVLVISLIAFAANAQTYHPMVKPDAAWFTQSESADPGNQGGFKGLEYALSGDTLIHDTAYFKLYRRTLYAFGWTNLGGIIIWNGGYTNTPAVLVGAMREDSAKRVWFYSFLEFADSWAFFKADSLYKLYDFNLSVGDTFRWKPDITYQNFDYDVVFAIDSVDLHTGELRKRYVFEHMAGTWIEGVGSVDYFFGPRANCLLDCTSFVKCHVSDSIEVYKAPSFTNRPCDSSAYHPNVSVESMFKM